jgi:SAM-dependent methyltransferase
MKDTKPGCWRNKQVDTSHKHAYMDLVLSKLFEPRVVPRIKGLLKNRTTFLEAGCGSGGVLLSIARNGNVEYAIGVDFEVSNVRNAKQLSSLLNLRNVFFVVCDVRYAPFRRHVFDLVSSLGVVEHFRVPQALIMEMKDILKPSGLLFLETPNKSALVGKSWMLRATKEVGRQDLYSPGELAELLHGCGMGVADTYSIGVDDAVYYSSLLFITDHLPSRLNLGVKLIVRIGVNCLNYVTNNMGLFSIAIGKRES